MSWFDLLLILVLAGYVWGGFWSGLIQTVGGLVGLLFGSIIATRLYIPVGDWVAPWVGNNVITAKIIAFILLFLLITRIIAGVFWIINRFFHLIAILPGLKFLNKLGGAAVGFIEGALFLGVVLQFAVRLPLPEGASNAVDGSSLAHFFMAVAAFLVPLFPAALKESQKVIDQVLPAP